ncbi:MAG: pirin family protein [bacterium]|nr:pirin family protein [bacterium]
MILSKKYREVQDVFSGMEVVDGAGVKLKRYIGSPYLNRLDPFLLLDEFRSDDPKDYIAGFPPHPHRGFQTLTYMVSGDFEHKDSTGSQSRLSSGELQWMNAGSGVIHSEMPIMKDGLLWGYQLWLNLPSEKKMSDPFYHNYKAIELTFGEDVRVYLLAGKFQNISQKNWAPYPFLYIDVRIKRGGVFEFDVQEDLNSFCLVSEGSIKIQNKQVGKSQIATLSFGNTVKIEALDDAVVLFGAAMPLKEPIARWGPFVMNTVQEIHQAIDDYQSGRLVRRKATDI